MLKYSNSLHYLHPDEIAARNMLSKVLMSTLSGYHWSSNARLRPRAANDFTDPPRPAAYAPLDADALAADADDDAGAGAFADADADADADDEAGAAGGAGAGAGAATA